MLASGQVLWVKANEGVPEPGEILGAKARWAKIMTQMVTEIGDTANPVALYVRERGRTCYNPVDLTTATGRTYPPGHIAALVWVAALSPGETVFDHPEDAEYIIGCRVTAVCPLHAVRFSKLIHDQYPTTHKGVWASVCGSMTGGKPFRLDTASYQRIADALTNQYCTLGVAVPPSQLKR
jgi:hypothetical protein